MNVHDEMSDNEVLRAASQSLSAMPMASAPDVEAIMASGRAHRMRRRSGVAGLSVAAAGTALALGLTGVFGSAPARAPGSIRTVSFTIASNSNGTATLTINPKVLVDAAALQHDLRQYGIPAMVTSGSFCSADATPAGFSQVVHAYPFLGPGRHILPRGVHPTLSINPAAIPAGTELSFGIFQHSAGRLQADFMLVSTNSYTCSSTPSAPLQGPGGRFETWPR
jgi:hypothetical protein